MSRIADAPEVSASNIEVSSAGWLLVAAALWELIANRLFTALGLYLHTGAEGSLAMVALSGRFAMNIIGVVGLATACILLPRLSADPRLARLPARLVLMVASPMFLPVNCVAIFRPVSTWLILLSYLIAVATVVYLTVLMVLRPADGGSRRILVALAVIQVIAAVELVLSGIFETVSQRTHLAAEALYLAVPIFAFVLFMQGRFAAVVKRPPVLPLLFAATTVFIASFIAFAASGKTMLPLLLLSVKTLGITLAIPGGAPVYLISLFFGALLVGLLSFPSRAVRPDARMRKQGFGLTCIFTAGLQPTHPYLTILVIVGFLYLAQSMVESRTPMSVRDAAARRTIQSESSKPEKSSTSSLTDAS